VISKEWAMQFEWGRGGDKILFNEVPLEQWNLNQIII
jgi:hypothetical protein